MAGHFGAGPGLIVRSEPYDLEAVTQDKWFQPIVDFYLTEDRRVRGIEIKPSYPYGRREVHHALANLIQDEGLEDGGAIGLASIATDVGAGLFMEWAVGKVGEIYPNGAGKLMKVGARIGWGLHLHAIGEAIKNDVVELGIYFYIYSTFEY